GLPLALLMIDVDHFKRFNDAHGHPAGDECLRRVAAALAGCARRPSDLVARVGGEEFAILLPHAGADEALAMAQHSLQAVDAEAIAHGDSPLAAHVTLSIGLATLPLAGVAPGDESAALLEAADAALYRAKEGGRHRVVSA
ncbi:MAG: GGDEF domain-containing protein, partial [Rubrivivax sp.]|nr:GGDEF domain-containing protein [Rubrivivax sp.]